MKSMHGRFLLYSTLTLFFGLQAFRVFLPKVIWYVGSELSAELLALFALGVFAMTLLFPLLRRWLGERRIMILTVAGAAVVYVAYFFARTALVYLILAVVGMILFEWFVLFLLTSPRYAQLIGSSIPLLALALSLAFLFDTLVRIAQFGNDIAWQHTGWYLVISLALAIIAVLGLYTQLKKLLTEEVIQSPDWPNALALVGLGGFLYLALAIVYNPSALEVASGWTVAVASLAVGLLACLSCLLCLAALLAPRSRRLPVAIASGVGLLIGVALILGSYGQASFIGTLGYFLTALALWPCLSLTLLGASIPSEMRTNLWSIAVSLFLALIFTLVVLFVIAQFEMYWMLYLAALVAGAAAVWAVIRAKSIPQPADALRADLWGIYIGVVLVLLPAQIFFAMRGRPVAQEVQPDRPLRVMTYNIHQGINADLVVDLYAIAEAIKAENPDVLVLNEVNRARATNGFLDVLPYLSQELDMPYVFAPYSADGQYGNAVLSRFLVDSWDNNPYQNKTTEVRGALRVVVQAPAGAITFYATHLDHLGSPGDVRAEQVQELLAIWANNPRSIIMGDLNATPDTPELAPIYQAGFIDILRAAGGFDTAFTFWNNPPVPGKRIDFIFITPDLSFSRVWIPETRASDHLPVVAEIEP